MTTQAEHEDDDTLTIDDDLDTQAGADGNDTLPGGEGGDTGSGDSADDEIEVIFGDEAAPASPEKDEPPLIRQLRAELRKKDQAIAALRKGDQPQTIEVGERPTLEACDYDEAKFETELDAWKERNAEAERLKAESGKAAQAQQAAFAEDLGKFARNKTALAARDFDAAEEEVISTLSDVQQAIVIKAAENSAAVIYALGKRPERLAELASIEDPIKFAAAVAKLEGTIKVTKRTRTAPDPDVPQRGSAQLSASSDKELERLEKEAAKTGNRTQVIAYKQRLKAQGRA